MDYFTIIPEAQAIIHAKGVYRQVPIYARAGRAYAKSGSGYVRLFQGGGTSHPNIRWSEFDPGGEWLLEERGGYVLCLPPTGDVVPIERAAE